MRSLASSAGVKAHLGELAQVELVSEVGECLVAGEDRSLLVEEAGLCVTEKRTSGTSRSTSLSTSTHAAAALPGISLDGG